MKNLRYLLFVIVFVSVSLPASSQIRFGVKGGVNIANIDRESLGAFDIQSITGFQVGPTMEAMLPILGVGADIGLVYSQRGFKLKNNINHQNSNARIGYLDIPLNVKWKPSIGPIKLYVAAGPYISFRISQNIDLNDLLEDSSFGIKPNVFSAGLNFGGGIELIKHLQVGFNYALGLTEDYKNDNHGAFDIFHPKSAMWSVVAAYYF